MVIAITGAAGRVGGFVVAEMVQSGHEVIAVDLNEPVVEGATFRLADIEDRDALAAAFAGCDAIVHLAAIAEEGLAPPDVMFRVNAQGTVNCLEAAVAAGVKRFVYASSEAVLGFAYRTHDFKPDYFPIDEDHPLRPQDSYGMSKVAAEEACRAYARKGLLETVCIRPCYCWGTELGEEAIESIRNPELHFSSLWVYIHLRDISRLYRLACEHPDIDHETFYAVAHDIRANAPTAELIERFYPGVPLRRELGPNESLISGAKAREVLGFEPELSWRDEVSPESLA